MQSRPQLEAIANYLTDFIGSLPGSTRTAVSQHIQGCLQAVGQEFNLLEAKVKQHESEYQDKAEPSPE